MAPHLNLDLYRRYSVFPKYTCRHIVQYCDMYPLCHNVYLYLKKHKPAADKQPVHHAIKKSHQKSFNWRCRFVYRPMQLHLKPAVKRGYASLMMLTRRRTSGRRRRSTMQHKLNPEQGKSFHPYISSMHFIASHWFLSLTSEFLMSFFPLPLSQVWGLSNVRGKLQEQHRKRRPGAGSWIRIRWGWRVWAEHIRFW